MSKHQRTIGGAHQEGPDFAKVEVARMTPEQRSGLARLLLRWPSRRDELMRAIESPMAEMFESYELASVALVHWSNKLTPQANAVSEDYRRIVSELEEEIESHLSINKLQGTVPI